MSVYELQADLTGVPLSEQSELRLSAPALRALGDETFRAREADLEAYVGMGGLSIEATDSPWLRALELGTIATPEQAAGVMEAMMTFTQHTLPEATARIGSALSLGRAGSPRQRGRLGPHPRIAAPSRSSCSSTTSLRSSSWTSTPRWPRSPRRWPAGRLFWHSMFDAEYRSAKRAALACAKEPKIKPAAAPRRARRDRGLLAAWREACVDGGVPRLPADLEGARGTYGQLVAELEHLERALGQDELEELGPDDLAARLRVFIADRDTLFKLPELRRLSTALEGAGLGPLLGRAANKEPHHRPGAGVPALRLAFVDSRCRQHRRPRGRHFRRAGAQPHCG